ncbi:Phytochrome-like protein cph1 [Pseudoalteromonas sp. P1-9]|uniref:sensor histidine kinase n=1 Tax=Pseudoalteromonas sp. P1-9 TaxID=1710354 RepID=UPI0006D616C6|nr:sensor histidine kinase [Pseudoalteromonas sp. P1-9]KPV98285.1 Phytochrome-like protein cph1 [Pseudoalteromonas sp. P1-9]
MKAFFDRAIHSIGFAWCAFVIIVLAIISITFVGLQNTQSIAQIQQSFQNTSKVMLAIDRLHIDLLNAESSQRAYLITLQEDDLAPYKKALDQFSESITQAREMRSESDIQQKRIDNFVRYAEAKFALVGAGIRHVQTNSERSPKRLLKDVQISDLDLRTIYQEIIENETVIRNHLLTRLSKARKTSEANLIWFAAISIIMSSLLLILLIKHLRNVKQNALELEKNNELLEEKVQERTQALELYAEELGRSNRELEDFAFIASHDLQEPLRKIRAFSARITELYANAIDDKGKDYLSRMDNAAARMSLLISDLLALSRVTTKGKAFVEVDLNAVLEGVLDDLEIAINESNATITLASMPKIEGDESQLQQLFLNLLSNALKFRQADKAPEIKVTVSEADAPAQHLDEITSEWIQIDVCDNGIGFEQDYSDKIFTPFQRLHSRTAYKGTGIGLSVCRRIVERHGGQITAHSEVGQGTTFTMILPIAASSFHLEENSNAGS